ncbi:MAG: ribosome maturation factor RimM [Bacteroidota bacterium]|nr:ribosome maturation factor RimM [Bacteroidota bacterium]MDP3147196.1 ribosome maturation factor RimM [Bacteroidota bacterium]MDP3557726.1 ribosome maturation factor RimM [Bacteroidota bacterium]
MDLSPIGYFSKTHGVKGQLIIKADKDFFVEEIKAIFIESSTGLAPYFVKEFSKSNNGFIIELEEVDAIEKAKLLIGKQVFISTELIEEQEIEFDWLGFEVIDKNYGLLGTVFNVTDNGQQILLSILYKEKEIILPLVDDFIEKIEEDTKKLYFNAPEGLIAVYLDDN